ncbi:hypothetical protein MRB53_032006 [Persea americana]|uniref:Uncharacterized protein n=1 Tax=Persea americana TaxID=3435 RepID=A0ACC2KRQ9_PERAE|nr:hypothetical protein MRB53_032006 [Persea americana]
MAMEMGRKNNAVGFPELAYVTFLAGAGDDIEGVVGLAKGLRKVKTAYPLVVAVLPDVPEEHLRLLENQGCILREIEPFEEFSKMIYLNADVQVYGNIVELFNYRDGALYAVLDCFCEDIKMMNTARYCQEELYFNSGMFIFEPSKKTCKDLLHTLKLTPPTPFAEQGSKLWRYTGKEENMQREDVKMLVKKWWDVYNDEPLDYKPPLMMRAAWSR